MDILDVFFFILMVVLIFLLICAIVGKIIAKQNEQKKDIEKPVLTLVNSSAA